LAFWMVLMVAPARTWAAANPATCVNDIDCIATPACGGDVCTYAGSQTCTPAGTGDKGSDGWCTQDSDCKCFAEGARCPDHIFCTFTKPGDAPGAGAGGKGGGSGVAGTSGGTGGAAGGTHGAAADAGAPSSSNSGSGGGCNVAGERPAAGAHAAPPA
jgi:hypothetical protein